MTRPTTGAVKSWLSVASGYVRSDEEDEHLRQEAIRRVELHDRLVAALRETTSKLDLALDCAPGHEGCSETGQQVREECECIECSTFFIHKRQVAKSRALLAGIGGDDD